MNRIRLYPEWEKGFFIKRINRFVMCFKKDGKNINAYIANPGRMEEYLVPGQPFFLIRANQGKYKFRVVSTFYENSFILLDTGKVNDIVETMIRNNKIPELGEIKTIRREFPIKRSRFDFLLTPHNDKFSEVQRKPILLEVKSCSLCHAGVAMFPDAPTARGKRHLQELEHLTKKGYETFTLYLITNRDAQVFLPNGHTDPEYCKTFNRTKAVHRLAYKVEMPDPVSVDISLSKRVPIDFERSRSMCSDGGCYLLVLYNAEAFTKEIGALGEREFKPGYYVYVGSALKGLDNRIKRHMRKNKKIHWHLDYVFPFHMNKEKIFKIVTGKNIERALAREISKICRAYIPGFGSSDTGEPSHFFYFRENPVRNRDFLNLLLDFRMRFAFGDPPGGPTF